jgi:hypothetical protein
MYIRGIYGKGRVIAGSLFVLARLPYCARAPAG